VKSPANFVTFLSNPTIFSAVFAENSFGPYSNRVTLSGSNFITLSQDSTSNCTGYVGNLQAQSCTLLDSQTVVLTIADTDPSRAQSFALTLQAGGVVVFASFPVRNISFIVLFLLLSETGQFKYILTLFPPDHLVSWIA
jgi:hypothetical protein